MNWKKENPKKRYIDEITWDEAKQIAYLAQGKPKDFELIKMDATCNGNNIPHVKIHYKYFEVALMEEVEGYVGIFHNLNIYLDESFHSTYCQREIFETFKQFGFD